MRKFHALFIGVDAYTGGVTSLNGCVNDALSIYEYIAKSIDNKSFEFHPAFLLAINNDKKQETKTRFEVDGKKLDTVELPTRKNILNTLQSYSKKVQAGDVFFFFYAGHGSTERAHPYFGESTGKLQTLVPCDSRGIDPEDNTKRIRDVLDKEIRYLIRKIWEGGAEKVEIIMVQDSCHSSEASRNEVIAKEQSLNIQEGSYHTEPKIRQAEFDSEFNGKYRSLADMFIFDEETKQEILAAEEREKKPKSARNGKINPPPLSEEKLTTDERVTGIAKTESNTQPAFDIKFPEAPHIHLSACGKLQFAYETNYAPNKKGGVFTHTLIKFLEQTGGLISYHDLFNRAKASIDGIFDQTPSIYVKGDSAKRYERFLGGILDRKEGEFNVTHQTKDGQTTWSIDAGALLGLPVLRQNEAIPVQLYNLNKPDDVIEALITYIKAEASTLSFTDKTPNISNIYKAKIGIDYFVATPLKIIISNQAKYNNPLTDQVGDIFKNAGIEVVAAESAANYRIVAKEGWYELYEIGSNTAIIKASAIKLTRELITRFYPGLGTELANAKIGQSMGLTQSPARIYSVWDNTGKTYEISPEEVMTVQYPYAKEALSSIAEKLKSKNAKVFVVPQATYSNPFKSYFFLPESEYYRSFLEEVPEGTTNADYIINIHHGQYVLYKLGAAFPAIKPSDNIGKAAAFQTMSYLRQMSRWQEIKELYNPHPDANNLIGAHLFELEIGDATYVVGIKKESPNYFWSKIIEREASGKIIKHEPVIAGNALALNFISENNKTFAPLKMTLRQTPKQGTNDKNLYVGVLSLSYDYEISSLIDAGAQDWVPFATASDGLSIEGEVALFKSFALPLLAKAKKQKEFDVFLKILVTYKRFDPSEWLQDGLPQPEEETTINTATGATRAILNMKKGDRAGDWIALTFPIRLVVPEGLVTNGTTTPNHTIILRGSKKGPIN